MTHGLDVDSHSLSGGGTGDRFRGWACHCPDRGRCALRGRNDLEVPGAKAVPPPPQELDSQPALYSRARTRDAYPSLGDAKGHSQ